MCNYKMKEQLIDLMLSIIFGFGMNISIWEMMMALENLFFIFFCYFLNIGLFLFYILFKGKRDLLKFIELFDCIYLALGFILIILWNLRDWIKIDLNHLKDSKGYPLYSLNDNDNIN